MKNLMEQRICSSIHAGLNTVRALLEGQTLREEEDDEETELAVETGEEREALERLMQRLERIDGDPKLSAAALLPGPREVAGAGRDRLQPVLRHGALGG